MKKLIALALLAAPAAAGAQGRIVRPVDTAALQAQITALQQQLAAKADKTALAAKADTTALAAKANATDVAAIAAALPQPATALPAMEQTTPALGSSTKYLREDYVPMRITRAGVVLTDAAGNWSITYKKALPSGTAVVLPIPMNVAGGQPIICNVLTTTLTSSSGFCVQARTLPATILNLTALLSYAVVQLAPTGTKVQIFAIPTTE